MTEAQTAWGFLAFLGTLVMTAAQRAHAMEAQAPAPRPAPAQVPSDVWAWPDWDSPLIPGGGTGGTGDGYGYGTGGTGDGYGYGTGGGGSVQNLWPGPAPTSTDGEPGLSREDVAVYQRALAELGLYAGAFDGRPEGTRTAIEQFQSYYLPANARVEWSRLDYPTQQAINQAWQDLYRTEGPQSEPYVSSEFAGWTP